MHQNHLAVSVTGVIQEMAVLLATKRKSLIAIKYLLMEYLNLSNLKSTKKVIIQDIGE